MPLLFGLAACQRLPDISWTPESPQTGQSIQFSASNVSANSTYQWNFGDQTESQSATPTHQYTTAGQYNIRLTLTSAKGHQVETSKLLTVSPATATSSTSSASSTQ